MLDKVFIDGLSFAAPLLVMAIGAIYSEKSGVTNLAVEGFQGFGAFVGALVAVILMPTMGDGSQAVIYIAMLAAFIGGGIYACIHALLCVKFRANQVISGVVVNILAVALTTFLTTAMNKALTGGQSSNKFILGISDRFDIPGLSQIPVIGALFQNMYPFEWIILAIAVVSWYRGRCRRQCGAHPFHCRDALGRLIRCWRHLFCLFHLSQLLSQHLYGLWISGHRRHDLWQLDHPLYRAGLPVLWPGQIRRLPALFEHGAAQ